jgi:diacylglycerol kinase family enzyme
LEVTLGDKQVTGVTAIVQTAYPYTYFGDRPVNMGEGATLDSGDLAGVVLERASPIDIPTVLWRALSKRARVVNHRRVTGFGGLDSLEITSVDGRPLPLQVDGDFIGETDRATVRVLRGGITVVA